MGWFWGASGGDKPSGSQKDPLHDLDPGLRDFLAKESPDKYSSSNPPLSQAPARQQISIPTKNQASETSTESTSKVPKESLFQDGRYASLWKTYRPLQEVESEAKPESEKIQDVVDSYKGRKADLERAALENCALEQWDVSECFRSGGIKARLTMCRVQNQKFDRCYLMQAKFLKALGYMNSSDRPAEDREKIQMHADTLYHRMLEQETAVEAAKTEGRPIPEFAPLLSISKKPKSKTSYVKERMVKIEDLEEKVQKGFMKRLENLTGEEREIEEEVIMADIKAGTDAVKALDRIRHMENDERIRRKETGNETIADKITSIFRSN